MTTNNNCQPCSECGCTPIQQNVGPTGIGIQSITNILDQMVITLTNAAVLYIPIPKGDTGNGISSIEIIASDLVIHYTDLTTDTIALPAYPDYVLPATAVNIVDITTGDDIKEIVDHIINYAENKTVNKEDLIKDGRHELPFNNYASSVVTKSNIGGTIIEMDANNYYIDGHRITYAASQLDLTDDKDDYIIIEKPAWTYDFIAVATGGAAPVSTTTYTVIAKVPVAGGIPGTLVQIIGTNPVITSMITDLAITSAKIANNAVTFGKMPVMPQHNLLIGDAASTASLLNMIIASAGVLAHEYVFMIYDAVIGDTTAKILGIGDIYNEQSGVNPNTFYLLIYPKSIRPEFLNAVDSTGAKVNVRKGDIWIAKDDMGVNPRETLFETLRHPGVAGQVLVTTATGYEWQDLSGS